MSEQEQLDEELLRIMLENPEYDNMDKILALNGILFEQNFLDMTPEEQDDTIKRLAIGIQAFNAHLDEDMKRLRDWRSLPKIGEPDDEKS